MSILITILIFSNSGITDGAELRFDLGAVDSGLRGG